MKKRAILFLAALAVTCLRGISSAFAQGAPDIVWEVPTPSGLSNSIVGVGWAQGLSGQVAMGSTDRWLRTREATKGALIYSILGPQHSRGGDQTIYSTDGTYFADLFGGFMLVGIGLGFSFVPVSIAALSGIPPREAGLASGLINTSQQIGGALGVDILTTVATTHTETLLSEGDSQQSALTGGFALAFWVAAAFAAAGVIATFVTLRNEDLAATEGETESAPVAG